MDRNRREEERSARAAAIAAAGGIEGAIGSGALPHRINTTLSETIILGLLRQHVTRFLVVLGHGSTEIGEVLRIYERHGIVRTLAVRSEVEASHAATALRWVTGERAAVLTSIGPGAMHAFAGALAPASNGLGVWYLFGDETTHDEGPNMQQIPRATQGAFLNVFSGLGGTYTLHTPEAVGTALLRGLVHVEDPHFAGPFFLLLPLNTQPAPLDGFNLSELPVGPPPCMGAASDPGAYAEAVATLRDARRVVLKLGAGAQGAGPQILRLLELVDAVAVLHPKATGLLPYEHPRNMLVGGSKGTLCGNFAMEQADLLLAVGTRAVCQSDSSRTAYPNVRRVININTHPIAAMHYAKTTPLVGDAAATLTHLLELLEARGVRSPRDASEWLASCQTKKREWEAFKQQRYDHPVLFDPMWGEEVLTQPAAIHIATDWARRVGAVTFFDAGDVQANGFQVVEDDRLGRTVTETGSSYMGFATSALLATALSASPFYGLALSGDGSFMMNPQVLIDGVHHWATGAILLLDNRRMAAISALQVEQYGHDFATSDPVDVDYVRMAGAVRGVHAIDGGRTPASLLHALDEAFAHDGLSLIHLPVYYGDDPLGGLGAYGRWNVGNWVEGVQKLRHDIGL